MAIKQTCMVLNLALGATMMMNVTALNVTAPRLRGAAFNISRGSPANSSLLPVSVCLANGTLCAANFSCESCCNPPTNWTHNTSNSTSIRCGPAFGARAYTPLDPADGYPKPPDSVIESMGAETKQGISIVEDLDTAMRAAYDLHIKEVGRNIYPMLYVDFTLVGGRYTLIEAEEKTLVRSPNLETYSQLKSCAHVPLGISVMISKYAAHPDFDQWIPAVTTYRSKIKTALANQDNLHKSLTQSQRNACRDILTHSTAFLDGIISKRHFTLDGLSSYTFKIKNALMCCSQEAANIQVAKFTEIVKEFKGILGSRWNDVYVVVSALWTLRKENVHELVIGAQMAEEKRETNLIVSEAVPTLDEAKTLLGRIIGDRIIAQHVFSDHHDPDSLQDIYSLSTERDLLSLSAHRALDRMARPAGEAVEMAGMLDSDPLVGAAVVACPYMSQPKSGKRRT